MRMKLMMVVMIAVAVAISLGGCTSLFAPKELVKVELEWIPNTTANGMSHWLPGLIVMVEVVLEPESNLGHTWLFDWDDGTQDEWNDNSHSQFEDWDSRDVFPWGNTRIGIKHRFPRPDVYEISIYYDGRLVSLFELSVELVEPKASYDYDYAYNGGDGLLHLIVWEPWTEEGEALWQEAGRRISDGAFGPVVEPLVELGE